MYRLDQLALKGETGKAGLCISWIPDGLLVELAQKKVHAMNIGSYPFITFKYFSQGG